MSEVDKPDVDKIAELITNAVMEHRLAPGSKLSESRMADAFKVSRTKIRQALMVLAENGLVQLFPNRGAFITSPTVPEALEVFSARRLLEPEVVRGVIVHAKKADFKLLHKHLEKESEARKSNNRRAIIRLSGDFHLLLASMCGNRYIEKMMSELCPLTCLIIALYDIPQAPACPENDHANIVKAIEQGEESLAVELMLHHLAHIESALHLDGANDANEVDWEKILG